jgi:hypothetical protein
MVRAHPFEDEAIIGGNARVVMHAFGEAHSPGA